MSSDAGFEPKAEKTLAKTEGKTDHYDGAHRIATKEQVPGHENYYERDGL
jgi:hypothetical protein